MEKSCVLPRSLISAVDLQISFEEDTLPESEQMLNSVRFSEKGKIPNRKKMFNIGLAILEENEQ